MEGELEGVAPSTQAGQLADWLAGRAKARLADWLAAGWLAGWLDGWLAGRLAG